MDGRTHELIWGGLGNLRFLTLAPRGLEELWNSQELLIESVGPVFLFCDLCEI